MPYTEIDVVYDGALGNYYLFFDTDSAEDAFEDFQEQYLEPLTEVQVTVEVYALHHDHDFPEEGEDECGCVQYLTDHNPIWSNHA